MRRGDVTFFRGRTQLDWTLPIMLKFDLGILRGISCKRGWSFAQASRLAFPLRGRSGPVESMVELLSSHMFLPSHSPLAFGTGCGNWSIWTQMRANATLGEVVALAGLPPAEYTLHSLRIGGATYLSVGGATAGVV